MDCGATTVVGTTVVGATVVGATVVGATVVGATVVGATVVGATVVRATVVGATVVRATVVGTGLTVVDGSVVEAFETPLSAEETGTVGSRTLLSAAGEVADVLRPPPLKAMPPAKTAAATTRPSNQVTSDRRRGGCGDLGGIVPRCIHAGSPWFCSSTPLIKNSSANRRTSRW